jgi:GntR family transcriptional regulator, transcriptional repressor for pyruvate dehydrogenase complex
MTSPPWQPLPRARTYELVLDRIEEQIRCGHLSVGDRLPPERDLAAMLGVSRAAIREALRVLEAQGVLLKPQVGTGPESGSIIADTPGTGLARLLRLHVALANFPFDDVVETRIILERASARLAAVSASAGDLQRMRGLLEQMDDPQLPRETFNDLDTAFHVAVAQAGGNRLVADLTGAMRNSLRQPLLQVFHRIDDWPPAAQALQRGHHGIYDAIATRDPESAEKRTESHIRGFHDIAQNLLSQPADPGQP